MSIDTAIFLGAGASKSEGAPLQDALFGDYFGSSAFKNSFDEMDRELATFFHQMFNIDLDNQNIDNIIFPTFEEVLGLTDLAILRNESFKDFELENRATNSGRLRFISQYLVFLVAKVLDRKLPSTQGYHRTLIQKLNSENLLKKTAFISTNYDIIIDNSLLDESTELDIDYGIDFRNFEIANDWNRHRPSNGVFLSKPHGSLNWLFCPTCNDIKITPGEKGVATRLISNYQKKTCEVCGTIFSPLIVPPTFYKDMSNVFLSTVWNKTDRMLRGVNHIIFCGYSFPEADMHIKYLLKRAQTNRTDSLQFTVINNYPEKEDSDNEKKRFKRFLGQKVDYKNLSFEQFVESPIDIIKP